MLPADSQMIVMPLDGRADDLFIDSLLRCKLRGQCRRLMHNLGTTDVIVQVYDGSSVLVIPESVTVTSSNVVTLSFGAAFTGSVVVAG
jgi:hypothetical protein